MGKNYNAKLFFTVVVAGLFAFTLMNASPTMAKLKGKEVKIGGLHPLTGIGAEWGVTGLMAAKIAIEEINAAGGIDGLPIKYISYDYGSKGPQAIPLGTKLSKTDKVLVVNGPCFSSAYEALDARAYDIGVVFLSMCSSALDLSRPPWLFRNTLTSDKQLDPAVRYWQKKYNVKKSVILYNSADRVSTSEGKDILPSLFKKYDIQLLETLTFQSGDIDFSAHVTKVMAMKPEGIALGSCYQEGANIIKEARKQGFKGGFVGGACNSAPDLLKLGGKATEGYIGSTTAWAEDPRSKVQDFIKKILKEYGKKPPYGAFRSYDNLYIIKKIIVEEGVTNDPKELLEDRLKIAKGLAYLKDFDGVSGKTTLNKVGDGIGEAIALEAKEGVYFKIESP